MGTHENPVMIAGIETATQTTDVHVTNEEHYCLGQYAELTRASYTWFITNFSQDNAFWEASSCSPISEIPRLLWNPKLYHSITRSPHWFLS
jgi:hypothetical protein